MTVHGTTVHVRLLLLLAMHSAHIRAKKFTLGESMRKVFTVAFLATSMAIFLAVAIVCSTQNSQAQTSADKNAAMVHAGQEIYVHKCFQCHSVNEGEVRLGPSFYGEMKKPHPKKSATEIRAILKNGKGKMPSFQDKLTQQDTDNLLAYIRTL
jgi:mono/diheme cytochrome c family protein